MMIEYQCSMVTNHIHQEGPIALFVSQVGQIGVITIHNHFLNTSLP